MERPPDNEAKPNYLEKAILCENGDTDIIVHTQFVAQLKHKMSMLMPKKSHQFCGAHDYLMYGQINIAHNSANAINDN